MKLLLFFCVLSLGTIASAETKDVRQSPEYKAGFRDGFAKGRQDGYQEALHRGLQTAILKTDTEVFLARNEACQPDGFVDRGIFHEPAGSLRCPHADDLRTGATVVKTGVEKKISYSPGFLKRGLEWKAVEIVYARDSELRTGYVWERDL